MMAFPEHLEADCLPLSVVSLVQKLTMLVYGAHQMSEGLKQMGVATQGRRAKVGAPTQEPCETQEWGSPRMDREAVSSGDFHASFLFSRFRGSHERVDASDLSWHPSKKHTKSSSDGCCDCSEGSAGK